MHIYEKGPQMLTDAISEVEKLNATHTAAQSNDHPTFHS